MATQMASYPLPEKPVHATYKLAIYVGTVIIFVTCEPVRN